MILEIILSVIISILVFISLYYFHKGFQKWVQKHWKKIISIFAVGTVMGGGILVPEPFIPPPTMPTVQVDIDAMDADAMIFKSDGNYNNCRTAASGTVGNSSAMFCGQRNSMFTYYTYRYGLHFNTASIPDDATIDSVLLYFYVDAVYLTVDFDVTVTADTGNVYPSIPVAGSDYLYTRYDDTDMGSVNTNGMSAGNWYSITLDAGGEAHIDKTGVTRFMLQSGKDIAGTPPGVNNNEYIDIEGVHEITANEPYLNITYTEAIADQYAPTIWLNFAGNEGGEGAPKYLPANESGTEAPDGYYTNASFQEEGWIHINCTIYDDNAGVGNVWLNWLNETTWTNWTYGFKHMGGNHYEINTSENFSTMSGFNYSFNVVANDTNATINSNTTEWLKVGTGGGTTRRYVQLNHTAVNISNDLFFITNYTYRTGNAPTYGEDDQNKPDRLLNDQAGDGTWNDTGYFANDTISSTPSALWCSDFVMLWYADDICVQNDTWEEAYVHLWVNISNVALGIKSTKSRGVPVEVSNDGSLLLADNRSHYSISGFGTPNTEYYLLTGYIDIEDIQYEDNDIHEVALLLRNSGNPSVICNESFQSWIIHNPHPDIKDGTDNSTDSDGDGLTDHMELNETYGSHTNPYDTDTDNDGVTDHYEFTISGSDPNNWSHAIGNIAPYIETNSQAPSDNSAFKEPNTKLYVIVKDDDVGDTMNITWRSNSTGTWVDFATNSSIGTGTNITQATTNFSMHDTTYWWSVNVTDGDGGWINATYSYSTHNNTTYYASSQKNHFYHFDEDAIHFHRIELASTYVKFNSTTFIVDGNDRVDINITHLEQFPLDASDGDNIIDIYVKPQTDEDVWFNVSGLKWSQDYEIYRDGALMTTVTSDAGGKITFNADVWSTRLFEIYDDSGALIYNTTYRTSDTDYFVYLGVNDSIGDIIASSFENITWGSGEYVAYWNTSSDWLGSYTFGNTDDETGATQQVTHWRTDDTISAPMRFLNCTSFTPDYNGTADNITVKIMISADAWGYGHNGYNATCAIHYVNGTLLGQTETKYVSFSAQNTGEWKRFNFTSNVNIVAGTSYLLGLLADVNGTTVNPNPGSNTNFCRIYRESDTNDNSGYSATDGLLSPSDPLPSQAIQDTNYSIYCGYTPWFVNGLWHQYHPHNESGNNFTCNTFSILQTYITDGAGTQKINMTENTDMTYTDSKTFTWDNTTSNYGFNFSYYNNQTGDTTLSDIENSVTLQSGESIALWNKTSYSWTFFLPDFNIQDDNVQIWDVIFSKVEDTEVWTT